PADREDPRPREFLRPGFVGGRPLRDAGRPAGETRFESQKKQSSMILADTSVWIEFLNGGLGSGVKEDTMFQVVTCLPVIEEIFQGLRPVPESRLFEERFLALPRLSDPLPLRLFL